MEHKWNTGRVYTAQGQIIRAKILKDGSIVFADISRVIAGHIETTRERINTEGDLEKFVMRHYDNNEYRADQESWEYMMFGKVS